MSKKVSIMEAVQKAMDDMGLESTNDKPTMVAWAVQADKRISTPKTYKKCIKVLMVEDCYAYLDSCTIEVKAVLLGDHGCDCQNLFDDFCNSGSELILAAATQGLVVVDNRARQTKNPVRWTVQNDVLVLSNNYDGQKITILTHSYYEDGAGFPMVNDTHTDAISQFLQWKVILRSRFSKNPIKIDPREYELEWHRLCADARATDEEGNKSEREERADIINDPISGHGMPFPNTNPY